MTSQNQLRDPVAPPWAIFESEHYLAINIARWEAAAALIRALPGPALDDAYDVGCGPGWFAEKLLELNLEVTGLEVRPELLAEARRRVPGATFLEFNADHPSPPQGLPVADLVFCFGLLYHLENPFNAVRRLRSLTRRFCLIESIVVSEDQPILRLVEESSNINQGFTHFTLIPSRSALVKMLYVAGFEHVYEFQGEVGHPDFVESEVHYKRRRILLASDQELALAGLSWLAEPNTPKYQNAKPRLTVSDA